MDCVLEVSATCRHPIASYVGARVEHIEFVGHIFTWGRNFNRTAGTKAWGNGLMLL